jgi:hypothetical protein
VEEGDYWASLEYRICREFAGMKDRNLLHFWCDGFIPERYHLDDLKPRITGRAWVCLGNRQEEWSFTLLLLHPVGSRDQIEWQSLLPTENVTRWLALDRDSRHIEIEPGAAAPESA